MSIILDSVIHPAVTLCFAYIVIAFCIHAMHWSDRYVNPAPESTAASDAIIEGYADYEDYDEDYPGNTDNVDYNDYLTEVIDGRWFVKEQNDLGECFDLRHPFESEAAAEAWIDQQIVGA